ncbi:MAG: tetratricopeptide repeat protein [Proteobacteria bacterium]|nr:tetratricopeptide repeat protein [Pseudomonadota bacterium]
MLAGCGRSAGHWTDVGARHMRDGDLVAAELAYNRALERDPRHVAAIYGKGWALRASGHSDLNGPARQLFQRAIDYGPDYFGGYRGMGVLLMDEGKVLAAEGYLRDAFERAPEEPSVLESLGQLYLRAGRLDEAEAVLRHAVEVAPARGELRRGLSEAARKRGRFADAVAEIERGRASAVSGRVALFLLDEGEALAHLEWAQSQMRDEPIDLVGAGQSLTRASTLLDELARRGFEPEAARLRTELLEPLEEQRRELSDQP